MNKNLTFLDILTILSFLLGIYAIDLALKNLEENRVQSKDSAEILYQLENHLKAQDDHLHAQDKHLAEQDKLLGKEKP